MKFTSVNGDSITGAVRSKLKLVACLAIVLSFFGCGGTKGGGEKSDAVGGRKITVRYDGKEAAWELKDAVFTTFKKGLILKDSDIHDKAGRPPGVVHRIYLANYDLGMTPGKPPEYRRITSSDHFRVEVQLEAASDAQENALPRAGEYAHKAEPYDRLSYVFISYYREGKDLSDNLQPSKLKGAVRIESATEEEIVGVIDVTDGEESVSGRFTARRL